MALTRRDLGADPSQAEGDSAEAGDDDARYINEQWLEFGGLRIQVYFRVDRGTSTEIFGQVEGRWTPMFRLDDFPEHGKDFPHFHAPPLPPPPGPEVRKFDRSLGEPHLWFVEQVRNHLEAWLIEGGFESSLSAIDFDEVTRNADRITEAIVGCIDGEFAYVPGVGLQRTDVSA